MFAASAMSYICWNMGACLLEPDLLLVMMPNCPGSSFCHAPSLARSSLSFHHAPSLARSALSFHRAPSLARSALSFHHAPSLARSAPHRSLPTAHSPPLTPHRSLPTHSPPLTTAHHRFPHHTAPIVFRSSPAFLVPLRSHRRRLRTRTTCGRRSPCSTRR